MLFKIKTLQGIKSGNLSLAFRKWKKPSVKQGTLLKTAVGQIQVDTISEIYENQISPSDAIQAGYNSLEELITILRSRPEGNIYKIKVAYHSPDPRISLRAQTNLSDEDFKLIQSKLDRFDQYSKQGKWTFRILNAIKDNPKLRAKDLAEKTGKQKNWLKPNIRKLKNLGLTISHTEGYSLSPRGEVVLKRLSKKLN